MDLWKNYKKVLFETFPDLTYQSTWCQWEGKINLDAKLYSSPTILKSREAEIWNEKTCIYNNIIYPKTGSDLPCFGMDLMGFFEKKVVITFDFQHPRENYLFSLGDALPKCEGGIRFFEPGNHFSEHLFVAKCVMSEVDNYLEDFTKYLLKFKEMLDLKKPSGLDTSEYHDFDSYMTKLDPVAGYLSSNFGKEKSEQFVNDFLFEYG